MRNMRIKLVFPCAENARIINALARWRAQKSPAVAGLVIAETRMQPRALGWFRDTPGLDLETRSTQRCRPATP